MNCQVWSCYSRSEGLRSPTGYVLKSNLLQYLHLSAQENKWPKFDAKRQYRGSGRKIGLTLITWHCALHCIWNMCPVFGPTTEEILVQFQWRASSCLEAGAFTTERLKFYFFSWKEVVSGKYNSSLLVRSWILLRREEQGNKTLVLNCNKKGINGCLKN